MCWESSQSMFSAYADFTFLEVNNLRLQMHPDELKSSVWLRSSYNMKIVKLSRERECPKFVLEFTMFANSYPGSTFESKILVWSALDLLTLISKLWIPKSTEIQLLNLHFGNLYSNGVTACRPNLQIESKQNLANRLRRCYKLIQNASRWNAFSRVSAKVYNPISRAHICRAHSKDTFEEHIWRVHSKFERKS